MKRTQQYPLHGWLAFSKGILADGLDLSTKAKVCGGCDDGDIKPMRKMPQIIFMHGVHFLVFADTLQLVVCTGVH